MPIPILGVLTIPLIKRFLGHFAVYLLIASLLFGIPFVSYQYGWRKGYSQCAKDRPTYGNVGTVVNQQGKIFKWFGIDLELLWGQIKLGH